MKKMLMGVGFAAVAAAVAQGCMPETLEVGRSPIDAGGSAGESGFGGDTGGSVAAKGGQSGSGSGSGGGSAGRGGTGSSAGRGGASPGGAGGGAGASGAGTGGVGDPRYTFDPTCDCGAYIDDDWGEFVCSVPPALFAEHFSPPENCEFDQDYVRRQACDGGTTRYEWQIYSENAYKMVFDGDALAYGSAVGYDLEEVCDFSFADGISGGWGTLTSGIEPTLECDDACAVCGQDEPVVPWCPCRRAPGAPYAVIEPLEEFCMKHPCPGTLVEARASAEAACSSPGAVTRVMRTGCGVVRVDRSTGISGSSYYYDETSSMLVGVSLAETDVPWGECNVVVYMGGSVPAEACSETASCDLCKSPDDGAAGAGGASDGTSVYEPCPP